MWRVLSEWAAGGDLRAGEVALGVVKSDTVHAEFRVALARAKALADSLDRYSMDSAAKRIRADLATVEAAAEQEFTAVRAGQTQRADSISQRAISPALRDADNAISPAEQVLRSRTAARVSEAEAALVDAERISLAALVVALIL